MLTGVFGGDWGKFDIGEEDLAGGGCVEQDHEGHKDASQHVDCGHDEDFRQREVGYEEGEEGADEEEIALAEEVGNG